MLGDACTLQANIPLSLASFKVPKKLLNFSETEDDFMEEINKDQLLRLGAR